ncbi:MAG: glycosyltransferase family 9 protein [Patescibacteria group bacterium]|nr:glycosyltransferase family 9 protein [Patescibacteria group bacterium]
MKKTSKFWFLIIDCNWLYLGFLLDFLIFLKNIFLPPALLVIRLDAIGDYVLFRNFLAEIKKDEKYKKWRLVLAGNSAWKSLAEKFDSPFVSKFIWIDRKKFRANHLYQLIIALEIKWLGAKIAIDPTLSRVYMSDCLVGVSRGKRRIGSAGYAHNISAVDKTAGDSYYHELIPIDKNKTFDFEQNKNFWETFLEKKLETKLEFDLPEKKPASALKYGKYAVLFPGAQSLGRRWSPENYARVAKFIEEKYRLNIIICGGPEDRETADKIISLASGKNIISLAGRTGLPQFLEMIAGAEFIITNDSCAMHLSAAVKTPTICVAYGGFFGRFTECPEEIFSRIWYAYPPEVESQIAHPEILREKFKIESGLDMNSIKAEKVIALFQEKYRPLN